MRLNPPYDNCTSGTNVRHSEFTVNHSTIGGRDNSDRRRSFTHLACIYIRSVLLALIFIIWAMNCIVLYALCCVLVVSKHSTCYRGISLFADSPSHIIQVTSRFKISPLRSKLSLRPLPFSGAAIATACYLA